MLISVDISPGELLDKITILEIKAERIEDPTKRGNVEQELAILEACWVEAMLEAVCRDWAARNTTAELTMLTDELKAVNLELWDIEDAIRGYEARQDFGAVFIALARAVYQTNDRRARIKRRINELLGSEIMEEKSYI